GPAAATASRKLNGIRLSAKRFPDLCTRHTQNDRRHFARASCRWADHKPYNHRRKYGRTYQHDRYPPSLTTAPKSAQRLPPRTQEYPGPDGGIFPSINTCTESLFRFIHVNQTFSGRTLAPITQLMRRRKP